MTLGIAIASNSGCSCAVLARTRFAQAARDFRSFGVRHPSDRGGEGCELFEIHVDRSKRISGCSWTTFVQRLAGFEAISRHGQQYPRYGETNASWEDA